ncbi:MULTISPECIES: site-specific integrase [unclassified Mesorhizobium]|uniref:site-specific integrase n=1 Tax=unclassified Mesorhizobium TaxID=325217 RepID=UPI000FD8334E|nr:MULTISPECIES: site-specific integrase [unclassified Mesorhizobium]TGQ08700.1 site-specific integrase [Mesorhizobium sp. M2E.F.Ca.ET.219.01.1.1]TGT69235.1 site-specific integrase [Mesorhizobium sp. M2E.F.Ca.ET.166.01.1.1]TGW01567.1 site-specific integrase [Mesorhizobium sp. M2E.F.Ca.ET.154.01.1.1]
MSVRKRLGTDKWCHDYFDGNGKRHQMLYRTQKEAKEAEAKVRMELKGNIHVADPNSITVKEAGADWLKACDKLERSTRDQYKGHLENHIYPNIGKTKLSKIGVPFVYAFLDKLREQGLSEPMVRAVRVSLGAMLSNAQKKGLVVFNAVKEMGRDSKKSDGRHKKRLKVGVDIPTTEEVKRIIDAAEAGRPRVFLRVAAITGMRASELRGLIWDAINLTKGEIEIAQRADAYGAIGSPKSSSGKRTIPIGPKAIAELREWKLQCTSRVFVFPSIKGKNKGGVMNHSNIIKDWWHPAQMSAGVTIDTGKVDDEGKPVLGPKYSGLHALRHYFASYCINAKEDNGLGLAPKVVQERLGHSSIVMTLDVYGHLFPKGDASAELAAAEAALF